MTAGGFSGTGGDNEGSTTLRSHSGQSASRKKARPPAVFSSPDTAKEKTTTGRHCGLSVRASCRKTGRCASWKVKGGRQDPVRQVLGSDIKMDGVEHMILREDDILGVIE